MKIQIMIILTLALIGIVSAETIYPGESTQIDLSNEFELYTNYSINGNTSAINISVDNLIATITIPTDYKIGSFEIKFNGYKADKVVEYIYRDGSSSSGSTKIIYKNNTQYKYLTSELIKEVPVNNETIKLIDNEKTIEVSKPFYKDIWFYVLIIVVIIGIIFLIRERSEYENKML